jgi:WD40 repeat protein
MEPKYWAFISYSHADKRWADWLHRTLENYRVPIKLVGRVTDRGHAVPKRIFPVFRDRDELPSSSDLGQNINMALQGSAYLIVISSPRAAVSRWVNEEILTFKSLGRENRVLTIIVDGEPNATDKPECGMLECFPPGLRFRIGPSREQLPNPAEPIAADARPSGDGKSRALLKLIAGILGVSFDELAERDAQRRRRNLISLFLFVTTLSLAAALFVHVEEQKYLAEQEEVFRAQDMLRLDQLKMQQEEAQRQAQEKIAKQQQKLAEGNEKEARLRTENFYEEKGRQYLVSGDPASAAPYLVEAWKTYPERTELQLLIGMALQPLVGQHLILTGHAGEVLQVRWSPDGKMIASADDVGDVKIWDANQGQQINDFSMNENGSRKVVSLLFSPNSKEIIATNDGGHIVILNLNQLPNPKPESFQHNDLSGGPVHAAVSKDGKLLATVGWDTVTGGQEIKVWQLPEGTNLAAFGNENGASACFSADGKRLLVASDDGYVRIWDWMTKSKLLEIKGDGRMTNAIFSPNEKYIFGTGDNNLLVRWNATSGVRDINFDIKPDRHSPELLSLEYSDDGQLLFFTVKDGATVINGSSKLRFIPAWSYNILNGHLSRDGKFAAFCPDEGDKIAIWDTTTGQEIAPLVGEKEERIHDAAFSPDGTQVAIAGGDHRIVIWDWNSVRLPPPLPDHESVVYKARLGTADRIVTQTLNAVRLWRVSDSTVLKQIGSGLAPTESIPPLGFMWEFACSVDGLHLATNGIDNNIHLYDGNTGDEGPLLPVESDYTVMDFSPDSELLAYGCNCSNSEVHVFDLASGTQKVLLTQKFDSLKQVRFDPTSKSLLVLPKKDPPTLWDIAANRVVERFNVQGAESEKCDFSPDGKQVFILTSDGMVRAWNADNGQVAFPSLGPFAQGDELWKFSADGKILSICAPGGSVYFFDAKTGKSLRQWDPPSGREVRDIQFWPNSHFAVMAVRDSLYFFDVDKSQLLAVYNAGDLLSNIQFTSDGTQVFVSEGKSARIIPLFRHIKDVTAAAQEVDRLDRWKLIDGHLIPK